MGTKLPHLSSHFSVELKSVYDIVERIKCMVICTACWFCDLQWNGELYSGLVVVGRLVYNVKLARIVPIG